jgi:D-alanine transaminase
VGSGSGSGRIGSFTTARVERGRPTRAERHAARLRRDALRLGLEAPGRGEVERLLTDTARRALGCGDGMVRIEWSRVSSASPSLRAFARPLGDEPDRWRAGVARTPHPGPGTRAHTKHVDVPAYDRAREEAGARGVDEVLLFDANGRLVEGGRTNLLLVTADARLVTPDLELGPVEGLGLEIVRENAPTVAPARLDLADVRAARELIAVNAVRGVVPIVELDGEPVGDGAPGRWARRLRAMFFVSRSA